MAQTLYLGETNVIYLFSYIFWAHFLNENVLLFRKTTIYYSNARRFNDEWVAYFRFWVLYI